MTAPLTPERLAGIMARCEAATAVSEQRNARRLLSLRQLARELGCRFETARELVDTAQIASVVVGNKRRVPLKSVDAWLERVEKGAA